MPDTPPTEVLRALDEVAHNGRQQVVRVHGKTIALVLQVEAKPKTSRRTDGLTRSGALWSVVGAIDEPSGPTDISANKHAYLTEAYLEGRG